jgi:hypothetical protein
MTKPLSPAALDEPEPLVDGEVAEFVAQLKRYAEEGTPLRLMPSIVARAADLLERLAPQPVPEDAPVIKNSLKVQPDDLALWELFDWLRDEWQSNNEGEFPLPLYARAVLARWGNYPAKPDSSTAPQPVPEGPSDEDIMALMPPQMHEDLAAAARAMAGFGSPKAAMGAIRNTVNWHAVDHARAVLDRWGR